MSHHLTILVLASAILAGCGRQITAEDEQPGSPPEQSAILDSGGAAARANGLAARAHLALGMRDTVPMLEARARVTNESTGPIHLEYGACALRLLAYRTADRRGAPVWDSDRRKLWDFGAGWACPMYLATRDLAAGITLDAPELTLALPLIEVLGDSLPDGRYWFTAQLRLNRELPDVAAGSADLVLHRPPLPASRISETLRFIADPVRVEQGVVHARGRTRLDFAGSATVTWPRGCALRLHAYRDQARRDAAPRSGAADWSQPLTCGAAWDTASMYRGQERVFDTTVPAREVLGAALPEGRYYFAVELRAQEDRVFLSAGDAALVR